MYILRTQSSLFIVQPALVLDASVQLLNCKVGRHTYLTSGCELSFFSPYILLRQWLWLSVLHLMLEGTVFNVLQWPVFLSGYVQVSGRLA